MTKPQQIADELRARMRRGELSPGTRLPASRPMARLAGVSRNVVIEAYDLLAAEGLIEARRGSGTRVKGAPPPLTQPTATARELLRAAQFPQRVAPLLDPDGNPLYLNRS